MIIKDNMANMCAKVTSTYMEFTLAFGPKPEFSFSFKLNKTSASVKVGKTTKVTAKATPSGKVTYKSGNKKIATVSSNGTIKGIKKGTAKITVTCNGVTKTVKVTVK